MENQDQEKINIVVVDDEPDNVKLLQRTFRKDYNVIGFTSPFEALEFMRSTDIDIAMIITDQRMPGLTGTELLAKTLDVHPNMIKILLTGYTDIDALIDGINKCELFQYVNKPWNSKDLRDIIVKAIEKYRENSTKNYFYFKFRETT